MASREAMLNTIESAYEARANENMEGLMTAFHTEAAFQLKGDNKIVAAARLTEGHGNVRATMGDLFKAFKFLNRRIDYTVVEGERAVVHSRVKILYLPSNSEFDTDILDVFTFRDGKIVQLEEFADTAMIKHLMGG